jgi:hypothetical protein
MPQRFRNNSDLVKVAVSPPGSGRAGVTDADAVVERLSGHPCAGCFSQKPAEMLLDQRKYTPGLPEWSSGKHKGIQKSWY